MAVDTEYLDNLMKSIEPVVYPDGVPKEFADGEEEVFGEDENYQDEYSKEIDSISEKVTDDNAQPQEQTTSDTGSSSQQTEDSNNTGDLAVEENDEPEELELDLSMSEEEIDALLNSAKNVPKEDSSSEKEEVTDLLSLLGDDESMSDIKDTLEKADKNIAVDDKALDEPEIKIPGIDDDEEPSSDDVKDNKKKKKEKKSRRSKKEQKNDDDSVKTDEPKEKKPGLFSRIFASLTEEEEEIVAIPESSETGITDENAKILAELDSEENVKDKKKKKKDKKNKKGKGSKDASEGEGSEKDIREKSDDEDAGGDSGKGKKKKPKKEKKAKKPKEETDNSKPSKKLPKKRVRNTFILCFSILAAIILLSIFLGEYITKKNARFAFDNQEYETTYADLYGMELSKEDEEIFNKSKIILLLGRKADSYENYMRLGMKPEALNALLEGYQMSDKVIAAAEEYDVSAQVMKEYKRITEGLAVFGLTEDDARRLVSLDSDVEYNRQVRAIAAGNTYQDDLDESIDYSQEYEDVLPEELDFLPDSTDDL